MAREHAETIRADLGAGHHEETRNSLLNRAIELLTLGPALFAGPAALSSLWIYLVGPSLGAVIAARLYEALRGGEEHAQGAPNDLFQALQEVREAAREPL